MKAFKSRIRHIFAFSWRDLLISVLIFLCATGFCALLHQMADITDGFASPVYVLAVLLISRFTNGYLFGLIAAIHKDERAGPAPAGEREGQDAGGSAPLRLP